MAHASLKHLGIRLLDPSPDYTSGILDHVFALTPVTERMFKLCFETSGWSNSWDLSQRAKCGNEWKRLKSPIFPHTFVFVET